MFYILLIILSVLLVAVMFFLVVSVNDFERKYHNLIKVLEIRYKNNDQAE
jgi:hypothetical protein